MRENILVILVVLLVFHFDKSCKYFNDEHPENILTIFLTLIVFHLDKSGKFINDEHP